MSGINLNSVMSKVTKFSKSKKGKEKIKECLDGYRSEGVTTTAAGSKLLTDEGMIEMANVMIQSLKNIANSYATQSDENSSDDAHGIPNSILAKHFDTLYASNIQKNSDGTSVIYINFGGDLSRDSLYKEKYGGVDNIIAIFNNGYHAKNYVYGYWHDQPTHSRKNRDGLHFIQQAISDFNDVYGNRYNVTAIAGEQYK